MHPVVAASYQRGSLASVSAGVAEAAGMVDGHMARAVVQMVKVAAGYMETAVVQTVRAADRMAVAPAGQGVAAEVERKFVAGTVAATLGIFALQEFG